MTENNENKPIEATQNEAQPKADGFFKRIFTKVDEAMKAKRKASLLQKIKAMMGL